MTCLQTLMLLALTAPLETAAFSATTIGYDAQLRAPSSVPPTTACSDHDDEHSQIKDRPLLRRFGRKINERVINSKEGHNRFGLSGHYTSEETIPCLNMQCGGGNDENNDDDNIASRNAIRKAYTASDETVEGEGGGGIHGRSSGSGCSIIRLKGKDAASVRGLVQFADDFFTGVDDDERNGGDVNISDVGMIRIANNVHAGFDDNVNAEGKMQVLYTKLIPSRTTNNNDDDNDDDNDDPLMLPMEVGDLVGSQSLRHAHRGMNALFDIGSQITSAVFGMDDLSTNKLLDDCTRIPTSNCGKRPSNEEIGADDVSNSYQRLIRYLKPQPQTTDAEPSFWPHVDSTFLTLIPMPDIPGLEVWCPSKTNADSPDLAQRGEWVRPIKPFDDEDKSISYGSGSDGEDDDDCAYVIALAGEFLQLLSDGQIPTCIHRVIPPRGPTTSSPAPFGFASPKAKSKYVPRISAPLFVRPRRGEEAILDVQSDLKLVGRSKSSDSTTTSTTTTSEAERGLYFEQGLMEECDNMRIWDYMDCMSPNN